MFSAKPRKGALTLVCYLALVLALASAVQADVSYPQARDHVGLSRMLKKRAGDPIIIPGFGTDGAAAPPPKLDQPAGGSSTSTPPSTATASSSSSASSESSSSSASSSSDSASASSASDSSSASSSSSSSSSSSASSSSSSSSSSIASTPTPTQAAVDTAVPVPDDSANTSAHSASRVTVAVTASPTNTDSSSANAVGAAETPSFPKTALTVIIVIASCIVAVAVGWTVIRKWKFKPSSSFEDRMAPIDWQPSDAADDGIPGVRRNASTASHGSFHSSGHSEENYAGHGMGGYGANGSVYNAPGTTNLQPIPDHDFTAGPTALAPVGGYADLARGPSPQPSMAELSRGPSVSRGYDSYGVPLHHQGAYEYNNGPRY